MVLVPLKIKFRLQNNLPDGTGLNREYQRKEIA
jgi:hypothetical protein